MFRTEYSLFLGKTSEKIFSGFVTESNFYLVVEVEGSTESGNSFLTLVKEKLRSSTISSLTGFESLIIESVRQANLPLNLSLAASYVHENLAYLVTLGEGSIFLKRGLQFAEIIKGNTNASGPIEVGDLYLLATSRFLELFSSQEQLKKVALETDVFTIVDTVYERINDKDDLGITALFFSPFEAETQPVGTKEEVTVEESGKKVILTAQRPPSLKFPFSVPFSRGEGLGSATGGRKRIVTVLVVIIIFVIFIWSVVLGYKRRSEAALSKRIENVRQDVTTKLDQAEQNYPNDPNHSMELIADARSEVKKLKQDTGSKKTADVNQLEQLIDQRENQITKKEDKKAEEFYDLSLDTKDAKANAMYADGDTAILLDKAKKAVYILSLSKKSLTKRVVSVVAQASSLGYYEDNVYLFVPDQGIFTLADGDKVKKIIDNDKDWGKVVDMKVYSGNIYLLDTGKNDIDKYLVAENGYSSKQSYLKSSTQLDTANSMAIDSAIYVGYPDKVLKFNGGLPTDFNTQYPDSNVNIEKVFTDDSLEKVYIWDKAAGVVYILGKTGVYEQQISSSIMKTASDFVISGNGIYFLSGSKIYKVAI